MDDVRRTLLLRAALNNAEWCDAVCRAHGLAPQYDDEHLWVSPERTPPMYPDAVTLEPSVSAKSVLLRMDTDSPGCSVKDSFAGLDLAGDGFEVLFAAQWIHRPAGARLPEAGPSGVEWSEVSGAGELASWEAAFDGDESDEADEHSRAGRLFPPSLLGEDVVFLAGRAGGRIVAGAVASTGGGVAGVSNLFARDESAAGTDAAWAGVLAAVSARWPDLDVVGYEHGEDLEAALRAGFTEIGPLQVWLRTSDRTHHLRARA
ncbi:hypothetical protein [Streptomyces sp. NPDC090131]|uniref:hypothetical protein n=1 Tax=Streptomyces sp. NPDC090131 TaxID=3365954 RepID=UPI003800A702